MTIQIEPGDIEQELRELFREKAGEAPLSTPRAPATAPPQVLRRGRRRQVGTVLGSLAVVAVLIAGSVAGLQRFMADQEPLPTGGYDVFERTATVEAFTVTSPSDWYLVNKWPLSLTVAVEGTSGSSSFECQGTPVGEDIEEIPECGEAHEARTELIPVHGLPMFQLTNADIGLSATTCRSELGGSLAVLYVAMDSERAIDGTVDPSIPPFPPGPGLPPESDGPCGPGRYAHFTVNGEPFFAWIGLGPAVSDEDREIVETAYERMSAIPDWTPTPPNDVRPGYVIAGGDGWRIELRGDGEVVELSLQDGPAPTVLSTDGSVDPMTWTGSDPMFGMVTKTASGVEFRPAGGGSPVPGTVVPVPPTLDALGLDAFFIDLATALGDGSVVALGLEGDVTIPPSPSPEPASAVTSLSGGDEGHTWIVRFAGSFADDSACIRARVDSEALDPFCLTMPEGVQPGDAPALDGWFTDTMYLLAGVVPPEVQEIRFVSDDGGSGITELQCTTGPAGWPGTQICALTLPPEGSGTMRYLDADGIVLFEDGMAWGAAEATLPSGIVDPVQGGTYWAVYPWIGSPGDPVADEVSAQLATAFEIEAFPGDLACDQGAAEALGTDAEQGIGVYFETEEEANAFARDVAFDTYAGVAQVTTYCLD